MAPTPIDRYYAAECIKREVDKVHKEAKAAAIDYLDAAREEGRTSLISTYFGEDAGEYKRGKTRAKTVIEYGVSGMGGFDDWCADNPQALHLFAMNHAEQFGQWWFEHTGELPDGISRVDTEEPPHLKAPQIYRYDHELIKAKLAEGGNLLEGANKLLLGDGDE